MSVSLMRTCVGLFLILCLNSNNDVLSSFADSSSHVLRPPRLVRVPVETTSSGRSPPPPTTITILNNICGSHNNGYLVNVSTTTTTTTAQQQHFFTVQLPDIVHQRHLQVVSEQAIRHECDIAINGGPFQSNNGDAVGGVVVNGSIVSEDFQPSNVGFGVTSTTRSLHGQQQQQREWILGGIRNVTEAKRLQVEYYMTGLQWLVYNGTIVVTDEDNDGTTSIVSFRKTNNEGQQARAPRTAIGVTASGHLMMLVTDGCEGCPPFLRRHGRSNRGLTYMELATLFRNFGNVHHAIALDGGSSTTLVAATPGQGSGGNPSHVQVLNIPTCMDVIPWKCERPVSTIVCLQKSKKRTTTARPTIMKQTRTNEYFK